MNQAKQDKDKPDGAGRAHPHGHERLVEPDVGDALLWLPLPDALTRTEVARLQRMAGNAAVGRLLRPPVGLQRLAAEGTSDSFGARQPAPDPSAPAPVQRDKKPPTLDEALRTGDSSELDPFRPFHGIAKNQLLSLVNLVTTQGFVSWREESILEDAWSSYGVTNALRETSYGLWKSSEKRGAKRKNVPWLQELRDAFKPDVTRLTLKHLTTNGDLVAKEMARFGLPPTPGTDASPQSQDQGQELKLMQDAARTVADVQAEQEHTRTVYVGYRIEYPQPEGKAAWVPVTFDPYNPPGRADAPPQPDPNDPSPMKDRTPVLKVVPTKPYGDLLAAYNLGSDGIRKLVTIYPMIYAVSRQGQSAETKAFADASDPLQARAQLGAALRRLLGDIDRAKGMLGKQLDPLDLRPVHQQLFGGMRAEGQVGDWNKQFSQELAAEEVQDHDMTNAMVALGLEAVSQMAFMVGSAVPGAGGLALMVVGLAAAGAKAHISDAQYQAMATAGKTAVAPQTELVEPRDVAQAKAVRDADQAALALGVINTAAAVAGALAGGAQKLTGIGKRIAAGERPGVPKVEVPGGSVGAMRRYRYEASPKHGTTARGTSKGVSNPAPKNGQDALDSSTQVKDTSPRRVGVDYATGELVVFDETHPGEGVFHGHVRSWNEMEPQQQNALIRSGLTDKKGRILTDTVNDPKQ